MFAVCVTVAFAVVDTEEAPRDPEAPDAEVVDDVEVVTVG